MATEKVMNRFLTVTLDPKACQAKDSARYIRECWRKLRVYFKRKFGITIQFISIIEFQKNGHAHLHILIDRYIPQKWIQTSWQAVGGGRFVNIKQVDIHRISSYLSKYLTKEILLMQMKPGTKRYTTSRKIVLFVKIVKGKRN